LKSYIVVAYKNIVSENILPQRIIHADTKINNILFDKTTLQPFCIIDYDTIMPGYYLSDLGDMIRTMVCTADENEMDKSKIVLRKDYYDAVIDGYVLSMQNVITKAELKYIHFAGIFMTYMQALRFITDYLNYDKYYSIEYAEHNFDRAQNQCALLQQLIELNSNRLMV
jgi:thiamine kinase-like enzyme